MKCKVRFGERLTPAGERWRSALTCAPGLGWVTVFLLLPLLSILAISFLSRGPYGETQLPLTVDNYRRFLGFGVFGFDPLYPAIVLRSLWMAGGTVVLCAVVALPLTFFIAGLPRRWKQVALVLLIVPFWTNMLVRTYAWQVLFAGTGWLAQAAAQLGWIAPGEALYPSHGAVFAVLVCDYLPVFALPLYVSVEKLDWTLAEAASDLGADGWRVFRHALLPQILPGLWAGGLLVFIPATGQFVIPDLLGGAKTVLLGNAIQQQFGPSRDWPFGSAVACLAMAIVLLGLWGFARNAGEQARKALT